MFTDAIGNAGYSLLKDLRAEIEVKDGTFSLCFWVYLANSTTFPATIIQQFSNPTYVVAPVLQSRSGRQDLKKLFEFINEPDGEENLPSELASAVPQTITVTPEENEAIQRLQDMGFDRDLVLEVFFACNKNEDLAANYLLDHQNEFED
ncbi:ubiquitin receptor RAD23d [Arachis ipaensis]|uniref:ubiquitin receptor RAD23d n=1 Tax=Arachis ipaensis TaxID=130454 RepID=UPI0007AF3B9F|nr:ubiquitin receptor RAD23d [Arachis ipaensis]